jgi:hypothetical protein
MRLSKALLGRLLAGLGRLPARQDLFELQAVAQFDFG